MEKKRLKDVTYDPYDYPDHVKFTSEVKKRLIVILFAGLSSMAFVTAIFYSACRIFLD